MNLGLVMSWAHHKNDDVWLNLPVFRNVFHNYIEIFFLRSPVGSTSISFPTLHYLINSYCTHIRPSLSILTQHIPISSLIHVIHVVRRSFTTSSLHHFLAPWNGLLFQTAIFLVNAHYSYALDGPTNGDAALKQKQQLTSPSQDSRREIKQLFHCWNFDAPNIVCIQWLWNLVILLTSGAFKVQALYYIHTTLHSAPNSASTISP